MILDVHVCIPFYIVYFRIFGHESVDNVKYDVLHFRIRHVKNQLCLAAPEFCFAVSRFDNVFGMLFKEFAL